MRRTTTLYNNNIALREGVVNGVFLRRLRKNVRWHNATAQRYGMFALSKTNRFFDNLAFETGTKHSCKATETHLRKPIFCSQIVFLLVTRKPRQNVNGKHAPSNRLFSLWTNGFFPNCLFEQNGGVVNDKKPKAAGAAKPEFRRTLRRQL